VCQRKVGCTWQRVSEGLRGSQGVYLVRVGLKDQMLGFVVSVVHLSWQNPVGHLLSIQVPVLSHTHRVY